MAGLISAFRGSLFVDGELTVHWDENADPNGYEGKWILWMIMLMSALSMFTHKSLRKRNSWFGSGIRSMEMAYALSSMLTGVFSLPVIIFVIYSFYPEKIVPIAGSICIVAEIILFPMIAYLRNTENRKNEKESEAKQ